MGMKLQGNWLSTGMNGHLYSLSFRERKHSLGMPWATSGTAEIYSLGR